MEIKSVKARDVLVTIEFDASEIDMILDVLDHSTVDTNDDKIMKAFKYVRAVFCKEMEQLLSSVKEKTDVT